MIRRIGCLAMLVVLCLAECAAATEVCSASLRRDLEWTRAATVPYCCPDDYCRKPCPCIACPVLTPSPNCVCRKPVPCLPCFCMSWRPDDYCPKPLPRFCWPVLGQYYRCVPGRDQACCPCGR